MNPFYQNLPQREFVTKYPNVQALVQHLYLGAIIDAYPRIKSITEISSLSENQIRNRIVEDFKFRNTLISNYIQNKIVFIASENQAYTASLVQRTDIEFFNSNHQSKFVIECKRLAAAEERYVQGRLNKGIYKHDGLEKFIDLTYASEDDEGAMLSFVIGGNPEAIINSLNQKVHAFNPSSNSAHLSTQRCAGWSLSFQSRHLRKNGSEFHLYHLFYDLT